LNIVSVDFDVDVLRH